VKIYRDLGGVGGGVMDGRVFSRWSHGTGAVLFHRSAGTGTHPDWLLGLLLHPLGIVLFSVVRKNDF
jgi:hypothetical protein